MTDQYLNCRFDFNREGDRMQGGLRAHGKTEKAAVCGCFPWAQLGSNQRPPDYESGAANQLSYGPR